LSKQAHALAVVPQHLDQRAGSNNIQHTDRNLSSSNIDGIRFMASGCGYVGDRRAAEVQQSMLKSTGDCHANCRHGCAKHPCVRPCRLGGHRSQSMR
jgi:hypothetical protein